MDNYDAVIAGLQTLRVDPPVTLESAVLVATGLYDGYVVVPSEVGPMFVGFNANGATLVLPAERGAEAFERGYRERFGRDVLPQPRPPRWMESALRSGDLRRLPVDLAGVSPFQHAVLSKTREIPRGEVRPYRWVAREIGKPGAVRAVGSALNGNPVAWLVPCHRVVRSDGQVGEYGFGPEMKRALLAAEGADPEWLEDLSRAGVRYTGSDTTRIYCYPTCRHARRVTDRHRVTFTGEADATAHGYRPCLVCRPEPVAA